MSDHAAEHHLRRALGRLSVDVIEGARDRDQKISAVAACDMAQHVQMDIEGKVGRQSIFKEKVVEFPYPIMTQTASGSQSESTLDVPHFNAGVEVTTDRHLIVTPHVRRWNQDDSGWYVSALMRIAVWCPDATKVSAFSATVHLTFFGFAGPTDADTEG